MRSAKRGESLRRAMRSSAAEMAPNQGCRLRHPGEDCKGGRDPSAFFRMLYGWLRAAPARESPCVLYRPCRTLDTRPDEVYHVSAMSAAVRCLPSSGWPDLVSASRSAHPAAIQQRVHRASLYGMRNQCAARTDSRVQDRVRFGALLVQKERV